MRKLLTLFFALTAFSLASCVYVALPETANPAEKLDAASRHMAEDQPLAAERLILEAIRIYETENDPEGLGNACRDFGELLGSQAVTRREQTYRQAGFLDSSVTFDNRLQKSAEYLDRAIAQYGEAASRYQRQGRYDLLTRVYYSQGDAYQLQNNNSMACAAYDQSRNAFAESAIRNTERPAIPRGYSSYHEAISAAKQRAACP